MVMRVNCCSWTWDIYYECYDVCGRDTDNNTVSFTEDSRAKSLLAWHTENCLQGGKCNSMTYIFHVLFVLCGSLDFLIKILYTTNAV